jgi:site-specific recombinase XerD
VPRPAVPLPDPTPAQADSDEQVLAMFLYQKGRRSPHTHEAYVRELARFRAVVPQPLRAITVADLQRYQEHLAEDLQLAPASQARALSTIRSLFTFARKLGYLPFNPTEVVAMPRVPVTSDGHFLTPPEAQALLDALRSKPRNYVIAAFALKTGLRVAEIAAVRWQHFFEDPEGRTGLRVVGKGTKARQVKITDDLWQLLRAYREGTGRAPELDAGDTGALFLNRYGQPISTVSLWQVIQDGARTAKIKKKVSPHWLRHTFGTLSILGGATLSQVREALGHSDIRTTQRYELSTWALTNTAADYVRLPI